MARRKVKLAYIENDTERKTSYKKRQKSVLKKTKEISTICGVEACAIVYSTFDSEPQVWPSESGVQQVLRRFRSLPEWDQTRNMARQESFITHNIQKRKDKLRKLVKDNKQREMSMLMYQCLKEGRVDHANNLNVAELKDLSSVIEQKLMNITTKLEMLNVNEMTPFQPPRMQIPAYQLHQIETPACHDQPQMEVSSYPQQLQMQTTMHQTQVDASGHHQQIEMQTAAYQPQLQIQPTAYESQIEGPSNQLLTQTPALALESEEMTMMNYGQVLNLNDNEWFMDTFFMENGDKTVFPPFGDNLPF
ncbi:hypothetical protein Fmac_014281 [Flemingia macrophylla]|uniref:MADS-box domain-containing protein n=1 Tax=Flemingia macrophylla TaxID=520843 RepID=A0ABD1MB94_9FABA